MPDFSEQTDLSNYASNQAGPLNLLVAATTGTSTRYQTYAGITKHVFSVVWSAGVTAGVISINCGTHTDQGENFGPFQTLDVTDTVTSNGANSTDTIQIDGPLFAFEVDITTDVVGGTVSVTYAGNS